MAFVAGESGTCALSGSSFVSISAPVPLLRPVSQTDIADGSIRLGSGSRQSAGEKEAGISRKGPVLRPKREDARSGAPRRAESGLTRRRRQPAGRQRVKAWPAGKRRQSVATAPPARRAERRCRPRGASFRTYCLPLERWKRPLRAETSLETHRRGGDCPKLARKRRSRRTGDPETAPSWTPSLWFAPLQSGQGVNLRRWRVHRAAICVALRRTRRQFASGGRRHQAACRRETRRLLSYSQNGRLDLNDCPQEGCADQRRRRGGRGPARGEKKGLPAPRDVKPVCRIAGVRPGPAEKGDRHGRPKPHWQGHICRSGRRTQRQNANPR